MMIRNVTAADAARIAEIYNHYVVESTATFETEPVTAEEMAHRIKETSQRFPYLVCETEGKLVGYCYAHLWKTRAAYSRTLETTIYIAPDARGKGVGSVLMRRLIEECRREGFIVLIACITADNLASIALHRGLGFATASRFHNVGVKFNRLLDFVDMELQLTRLL